MSMGEEVPTLFKYCLSVHQDEAKRLCGTGPKIA
jgi:hypothetical protein